jgi:hypothetical protein
MRSARVEKLDGEARTYPPSLSMLGWYMRVLNLIYKVSLPGHEHLDDLAAQLTRCVAVATVILELHTRCYTVTESEHTDSPKEP